jgi:hypothetical protein
MTGIFSFGNVTGLVTLLALAAGIFWVMAQRNQPVVSMVSMLRGQNRER